MRENLSGSAAMMPDSTRRFTASPATTIQQAAALMARDTVGTLVSTEGDRVVGIVTDRDVALQGFASESSTVGSVMTPVIATVSALKPVASGGRQNALPTRGPSAAPRQRPNS